VKTRVCFLAVLLISFLSFSPLAGGQQKGQAQLLSEENLSKLLPASVFLDGQNVPVQRRNAVGARMADGKILIVTFLDSSGYSSDYKEKYTAMVLTQGSLVFGKSEIKPGAYGLGKKKTTTGGTESQTFNLYDLGGNAVGTFPAVKDEKLRPVPTIHLTVESGQQLRLYLGAYFITLTSR
jgi:hypothetical protein